MSDILFIGLLLGFGYTFAYVMTLMDDIDHSFVLMRRRRG
jgi:hypothetical protein